MDQIDYLIQPVFARFKTLAGKTRCEAEINDAEDGRLQKRCKLSIERTIDKDIPIKIRIHEWLLLGR